VLAIDWKSIGPLTLPFDSQNILAFIYISAVGILFALFVKFLVDRHLRRHAPSRLADFPKHVALIWRPGAGKGTHGPVLAKEIGLPYIATGDLVRRAARTDEFPEVRRVMESGKLIDDMMMWGMLQQELAKPKYRLGYVLDGFPRNLKQLQL